MGVGMSIGAVSGETEFVCLTDGGEVVDEDTDESTVGDDGGADDTEASPNVTLDDAAIEGDDDGEGDDAEGAGDGDGDNDESTVGDDESDAAVDVDIGMDMRTDDDDDDDVDADAVLSSLDDELDLKDKKFLRTVRDINQSPESFNGTDPGVAAANKSVIADASELSKSAVEYRLSRGDLGEDEMGLIKIHPAQVENRRFGPKSAALTSQGRKVLSALEAKQQEVGGMDVDKETIKQLMARVEALEDAEVDVSDGEIDGGELMAEVSRLSEQVNELSSTVESQVGVLNERVESIEEVVDAGQTSEWGLLDEATSEDLDRVLRLAPATTALWGEVFGIELPEVVQMDGLTPEYIEELRRSAYKQLADSFDDGQGDNVSVDTPDV